jgi:predicted small secreted protein
MMRRLYALSICFFLLVAACGKNTLSGVDADSNAGGPKISITSPKDGSTVKAIKAATKVKVTGFNLENKMGMKAEDGEGHIIYYIWNGFGDGAAYQIPTTPGQPANSGGTGYVAVASAETKNDWSAFVQPGRQTFAAQLVNNDNTPLDPPQIARVIVEVKGEKATPAPSTDEEPGQGGKGPNG